MIKLWSGRGGIGPHVQDWAHVQRAFSVICIAAVLVFAAFENGSEPSGLNLLRIAGWSLTVAVAGLLVWLTFASHLVIKPKEWSGPKQIVVGPWITREAAAYRKEHDTRNRVDLLAGHGNREEDVDRVWSRTSQGVGKVLVFITAVAINIGGPTTLTALAFNMMDLRVKEELSADGAVKLVRLPSHFVFATGEYELADMNASALEAEIENIVAFQPSRIEVHGHADGEGDDPDNLLLSQRRAASVLLWLQDQPALANIMMSSVGHGESALRFEEEGLSGYDLAKARRGNRRVELILYRE
ncbi:MAG: OmpA family protein [Pseudomonadota bacterium]